MYGVINERELGTVLAGCRDGALILALKNKNGYRKGAMIFFYIYCNSIIKTVERRKGVVSDV